MDHIEKPPITKGPIVIALNQSSTADSVLSKREKFLDEEWKMVGYVEAYAAKTYILNCCEPPLRCRIPQEEAQRDPIPCIRAKNSKLVIAILARTVADIMEPKEAMIQTSGAALIWCIKCTQAEPVDKPENLFFNKGPSSELYTPGFKSATRMQLTATLKERLGTRAF
ncbi:hypothetical protein, partial [Litorimonas sp.]|uniref:hypothetical protein n=1 Tax=Litorimonas sp. TaxID=1892381 RepID=UPI003A876DA3